MKLTLSTSIAALLLAGAAASPALAQGTWNLGGSSCNPAGGSPTKATCTVGTVTASIEAWGKNPAGNAFVQYNLGAYDPNGFGASQVGGNETGTNGHHAFDNVTTGCGSSGSSNTNCGGTQEFMLLNFGANKVNLSSLAIGWWSGDADMSIYRWDGGATGQTTMKTAGGANSLSDSWKLVASEDVDTHGAVVGGTRSFGVNDTMAEKCGAAGCTSLYSSWWLVSTYVGGVVAGKSLDQNRNDRFKLYSFTAGLCAGTVSGNGGSCTPSGGSVPEPGSLALAGLALVGVAGLRRRRPSLMS